MKSGSRRGRSSADVPHVVRVVTLFGAAGGGLGQRQRSVGRRRRRRRGAKERREEVRHRLPWLADLHDPHKRDGDSLNIASVTRDSTRTLFTQQRRPWPRAVNQQVQACLLCYPLHLHCRMVIPVLTLVETLTHLSSSDNDPSTNGDQPCEGNESDRVSIL